MLKVSVFYLEGQKSFIHKKYFLSCFQYQNIKALFTDPIFSEGFGTSYSDHTHCSEPMGENGVTKGNSRAGGLFFFSFS